MKNYLLDTHTLLWWLWADPKLSKKAGGLIADPANQIYISAACVWELAIKKIQGKISLPATFFKDLKSVGLPFLTINEEQAWTVSSLPFHHKDPFDRILVAQALTESLAIISKDTVLDSYGVNRKW